MKAFLDKEVIPLLQGDDEIPRLELQGEIHSPSVKWDTVCVFLIAEPGSWVEHVRRLMVDEGFLWDYMRELEKVELEGKTIIAFGGDGSSFIHDSGMVSCRLFKKAEQASIILEIGSLMGNKIKAADETKRLYDTFKKVDGLDIHQVSMNYAPPFGGA